MAQFSYIADENDQFTGFEVIPNETRVRVQIIDTDIAPSKGGNAEMLKITYEVVADAKFEGRKIFDNLIIKHETSADAVRIGKQKINTICALTGVKSLKDTAQLHHKPFSLLLGVKEYQGEKQNFIKKYLPFHDDGDVYSEETEDEAPRPTKSFIKK